MQLNTRGACRVKCDSCPTYAPTSAQVPMSLLSLASVNVVPHVVETISIVHSPALVVQQTGPTQLNLTVEWTAVYAVRVYVRVQKDGNKFSSGTSVVGHASTENLPFSGTFETCTTIGTWAEPGEYTVEVILSYGTWSTRFTQTAPRTFLLVSDESLAIISAPDVIVQSAQPTYLNLTLLWNAFSPVTLNVRIMKDGQKFAQGTSVQGYNASTNLARTALVDTQTAIGSWAQPGVYTFEVILSYGSWRSQFATTSPREFRIVPADATVTTSTTATTVAHMTETTVRVIPPLAPVISLEGSEAILVFTIEFENANPNTISAAMTRVVVSVKNREDVTPSHYITESVAVVGAQRTQLSLFRLAPLSRGTLVVHATLAAWAPTSDQYTLQVLLIPGAGPWSTKLANTPQMLFTVCNEYVTVGTVTQDASALRELQLPFAYTASTPVALVPQVKLDSSNGYMFRRATTVETNTSVFGTARHVAGTVHVVLGSWAPLDVQYTVQLFVLRNTGIWHSRFMQSTRQPFTPQTRPLVHAGQGALYVPAPSAHAFEDGPPHVEAAPSGQPGYVGGVGAVAAMGVVVVVVLGLRYKRCVFTG